MIEHKVKEYIKEHSMLKDGDKVIVTLSGGADSVSLLLILHALGYECHAAHCNFHLRGEESMRDERFVTSLCERLNIPLHKTDFETETYSKEKGISIEMAARELRYDYFRKLKDEVDAKAIAVGHHRDDNIETLFLNLVRGTGIQGLCGIQPVNGDIVRPLLCVSREEILDYLAEKGQTYVTDSTNLEDVYSRNKIRLNVLPELQQINQGAMENIRATIGNLNEVRKIYEATIKADIERCKAKETDTYNIKELFRCISPTSVLHEIIYPLGFNKAQEADILNAAKLDETGKMFYSASHIITIDRGRIVVSAKGKERRFPVSLNDFKEIECRHMNIDECVIIKDKAYAFIDADKVKGELIVRPCKTGDAFTPFGMNGRKLLSDYMTDRKFNRLQKMSQLVLCDADGEIVWLIGERASDKYRIDEGTRRVIKLKNKKQSPSPLLTSPKGEGQPSGTQETKEYNIQEGLTYATSMLKTNYFSSLLKDSSYSRFVVSAIVNSGSCTSAPPYYTSEGVKYLQNVLNDIVANLAKVSIISEPQSEEQFPLCYGDDYVSKFKVLGKVIKLPYLFQDLLGKTERWQKMHLSDKSQDRYYNKFTEEELKQINAGISTIASNIASINLVYDEELEKEIKAKGHKEKTETQEMTL